MKIFFIVRHFSLIIIMSDYKLIINIIFKQQKTNYYQKQLNTIRLYYNTGRQFAQGTFDKNTSILFDKNII